MAYRCFLAPKLVGHYVGYEWPWISGPDDADGGYDWRRFHATVSTVAGSANKDIADNSIVNLALATLKREYLPYAIYTPHEKFMREGTFGYAKEDTK